MTGGASAMHRVKVRRMGSNILAIENGKPFMARPEGWDKTGIVNTIKRAFTLKYEIFDEKGGMVSCVEFEPMKNYILIKKDAGNVALNIPVFYLNAQKYYLNEKMSGFQVWPLWDSDDSSGEGIEIVIEGKKSHTEYSIEMDCSDDNFQFVLREWAVGLLVRWMSYLY